MKINYKLFFRKYWYGLVILICAAGFMTPGLTFLSFMFFIFISGMGARPHFDNLIKRFFYQEQREYAEPLSFSEIKPRRKKT